MPEIDFKCVVCQVECAVAPSDGGWAFCESCCPDHNYEYDQYERQRICVECGKPAPDDFYFDDDCVPLSFAGEPIGTPLSQVTGAQLDRIANEWMNI